MEKKILNQILQSTQSKKLSTVLSVYDYILNKHKIDPTSQIALKIYHLIIKKFRTGTLDRTKQTFIQTFSFGKQNNIAKENIYNNANKIQSLAKTLKFQKQQLIPTPKSVNQEQKTKRKNRKLSDNSNITTSNTNKSEQLIKHDNEIKQIIKNRKRILMIEILNNLRKRMNKSKIRRYLMINKIRKVLLNMKQMLNLRIIKDKRMCSIIKMQQQRKCKKVLFCLKNIYKESRQKQLIADNFKNINLKQKIFSQWKISSLDQFIVNHQQSNIQYKTYKLIFHRLLNRLQNNHNYNRKQNIINQIINNKNIKLTYQNIHIYQKLCFKSKLLRNYLTSYRLTKNIKILIQNIKAYHQIYLKKLSKLQLLSQINKFKKFYTKFKSIHNIHKSILRQNQNKIPFLYYILKSLHINNSKLGYKYHWMTQINLFHTNTFISDTIKLHQKKRIIKALKSNTKKYDQYPQKINQIIKKYQLLRMKVQTKLFKKRKDYKIKQNILKGRLQKHKKYKSIKYLIANNLQRVKIQYLRIIISTNKKIDFLKIMRITQTIQIYRNSKYLKHLQQKNTQILIKYFVNLKNYWQQKRFGNKIVKLFINRKNKHIIKQIYEMMKNYMIEKKIIRMKKNDLLLLLKYKRLVSFMNNLLIYSGEQRKMKSDQFILIKKNRGQKIRKIFEYLKLKSKRKILKDKIEYELIDIYNKSKIKKIFQAFKIRAVYKIKQRKKQQGGINIIIKKRKTKIFNNLINTAIISIKITNLKSTLLKIIYNKFLTHIKNI